MNKKILKQMAANMAFAINPMCCGAVAVAPVPATKHADSENKFVTKSVKIGECVISYNISQKRHKKALILQHGAFMNNLTMMGLADLFNDYSVIVPDLPGHGKSTTPSPIENVEKLTDIEYNFILKLKENGAISKDADITYLGWSMGGSIGLRMALKEKIVNRLVLVSSSPVWKTIPEIPADKFVEIFKDMFFKGLSSDVTPEKLKWLHDNFYNMLAPVPVSMNDITACRSFDIIQMLPEISIPVLIISGTKDCLALPECQLTLVENMQHTKLVLIGDEYHGMVLGCPEKVYAEMIKFIG